ncbi:MAG: cation:proton antiporter [Planctomycetes bacterium]|nr:cation:proton antiporter [Planctomycetota bacterium]
MHHLIQDIATCIAAAWLLGMVAQWLRQPVLLAYLAAGFLLGPEGVEWVHERESVEVISELGLIFLLFMIGLEIDLKKIIAAGSRISLTALVQIGGGAVLGLAMFSLCGFSFGGPGWDALYIAVAAALSSTVIIVKLLYDKHELDTIAGRVTLGVLVLQDLFAILFLAVQPSLNQLDVTVLLLSLGRVVVLVAVALAVSRFVLPVLFQSVARLPELVLVGALGWCFLVGELGAYLELSREMGALVAGVALSTFPYALDVTAKVTTLRDFFVTLFFVGLGMKIPIPGASEVVLALGLMAFVIASRLVTTFAPLFLLRSGLRLSLLPAIYLCQVSEFSLVVIELGAKAGHVSPTTSAAMSLSFVVLAVVSTFGMMRSESLLSRMIPLLQRLGLKDLSGPAPGASARADAGHGVHARIVLLGFYRTASSLLEELLRHAPDLAKDVAVVDFNPETLMHLKARGIAAAYGDISQKDTLAHAGIGSAEILVCTLPDSLLKGTTNAKLVKQLRDLNPKARILVPAERLADVATLRAAGADYVHVPRVLEGVDLASAVRAACDQLLEQKQSELEQRLAERREVLG